MGALGSLFRKDPRQPVGAATKVKHIFIKHHRGILGCLIPLVLLPWQPEKTRNDLKVQVMWLWMFFSFLLQPVNVPVTGFIPLFLLPMTGVLSTKDVCQCYFNENILLFIIGGMLVLLMNNSGVDRRIALWLLCSGDACQFSGKRIVFKASTAAFFLSMFSNRLIAASTITQYLMPALTDLQSSTSRYRSTEPDYDEMRYIIMNAIQTASAIGSTAIMHSAFATLAMRAIWCESPPKGKEYPDIFNYLQYSAFAFPVAFLMFILNFSYHMLLINWCVGKPMSASSMNEMKKALLKQKTTITKKVSSHEKLTIFFSLFALLMLLFRWCDWLNMGWTTSLREPTAPTIPGVKDGTVATIFVVALHVLPRTFGFMKFLNANKKSELGVLKPDSCIMWWRFMDKNTNYGYIILIGGGIALNMAIRESKLANSLSEHLGKNLTGHPWAAAIFLVVLITVILANVMSGVAACCVFLPFVINMALAEIAPDPWPKSVYLGALGVGIGSSFGFVLPFLFTPAYFCHNTGKVPIRKMLKYSIGSLIICIIILWLALCHYGPVIWDPNGNGVLPVDAPTGKGAAEGGGGGGGEGGGGGGGGGEEEAPPPERA